MNEEAAEETLGHLLRDRIDRVRARGGQPLAVLDVDLTLLDNAERNRAIWTAFGHRLRGRWDGAADVVRRARDLPIAFGVDENMKALGIDRDDLRRDGLRFWLEAFFSERYLPLDRPFPGAVEAVRRLRTAGVDVVYLTARPTSMIAGTAASFREAGLPAGVPGATLVMKEDRREPDDHYKERALAFVGRLGDPVLAADNEPAHVNAMLRAFPEALAVHVTTRHSSAAPPLDPRARPFPSLLEAIGAPS